DGVEFDLEAVENGVVREGAEVLFALFEVHEGGRAPKPEVGVVSFAGAVHAAAHDGDRDVVVLRVFGHLADLEGEVDERLVFDAAAARAADDVQAFAEVPRYRAEA